MNVFLQYFLGFTSFTNEAPFSPSLFVEIREQLGIKILSSINHIIIAYSFGKTSETNIKLLAKSDDDSTPVSKLKTDILTIEEKIITENKEENNNTPANTGKQLMDATVVPQNITFLTDLKRHLNCYSNISNL